MMLPGILVISAALGSILMGTGPVLCQPIPMAGVATLIGVIDLLVSPESLRVIANQHHVSGPGRAKEL